jgi:hypothetical protein
MPKLPLSRFRIALNVSLMNDLDRLALIAGIQKGGATSSLMQVPAIAASYAAVVKKGAALKANNDLVAADQQQLKLDETSRDASRADADAEIVALKTLVAHNATSAADVASMGFKELVRSRRRRRTSPASQGRSSRRSARRRGERASRSASADACSGRPSPSCRRIPSAPPRGWCFLARASSASCRATHRGRASGCGSRR